MSTKNRGHTACPIRGDLRHRRAALFARLPEALRHDYDVQYGRAGGDLVMAQEALCRAADEWMQNDWEEFGAWIQVAADVLRPYLPPSFSGDFGDFTDRSKSR